MFKVGADWNPKQAQLKILIRDPDRFAEAISLCRELHGMVHFARLTGREKVTFGDEAWAGVSEEAFSIMPTSKDVTIIQRILKEGGVTTHPDSIWLLDFWGKKDVAGLLMMPVTRHQVGHLSDCIRLKGKIRKMKLTC